MNDIYSFISIAIDECTTIQKYIDTLHRNEDEITSDDFNTIVKEIISDELNHALVSLFNLSNKLDISIPMDNFPDNIPLKE